jgi:hypothetical protein
MPKSEVIPGDQPVTLTRSRHGWMVGWRKPIAQSILAPSETVARLIADLIAAGEVPLIAVSKGVYRKARAKVATKAGAKSWEGMTPEQRSARAKANAAARWARVKGTPSHAAAKADPA